nr:formin-like protein 14 [Lolium perenne]
MGDRDFPFDRPLAPRRRRRQAPMPAHDDHDDNDGDDDEDYNEALAYQNDETKDDSDDYVTCIFQEWQLALAEGWEFDYPDNMTDDEIVRLDLLVSEVDRPMQPPLPRYATGIMPPGLSEEETLPLALHDSSTPPVQPPPPPPPYNPWGAPAPAWAPPPPPQAWAPPPPTPSARPTYVPPLLNWPWVVPELVVINSDEEKQ